MTVKAYIHSLKDQEHNRHVLGEAEIIKCIGDKVVLNGRLQTRSWTDKGGNKRVSVEIVAESAYFADSRPAEDQSQEETTTKELYASAYGQWLSIQKAISKARADVEAGLGHYMSPQTTWMDEKELTERFICEVAVLTQVQEIFSDALDKETE